MNILDQTLVLVLNRNWMAINATSPAHAFCLMANESARGLDICPNQQLTPIHWEEWLNLPVRKSDYSLNTVRGSVRVPTVILLSKYNQIPMVRPRFSAKGIRDRDQGKCQYTGRKLSSSEGDIDHIIPRSRGGDNSWENCVLSAKEVNSQKGNKTPEEAGLSLIRQPKAPALIPSTFTLNNHHKVKDWELFLPA